MNRAELKNKAKEKIKGNKWYLWKPLVIFELCAGLLGFVVGLIAGLAGASQSTTETVNNILSTIISILECAFIMGYTKYCLDFVRGKTEDWKVIIDYAKEHFVNILLVSILVGLAVMAGTILFIIPGIIIGIGLTFYQEVFVDNPDLNVTDVIKKAWELTKGHKGEIFVLGLSFIGWSLLGVLTLFILYIWLVPYINITFILCYEELRKSKK
ncbi:MAG: DUF975 family protein [Bacilli bacterium]|nr:DUF975 family protein [Bacilli bacterium]